MAKVKTALVSLSDKTGVVEFAGELTKLGIEIMSTGGTAKLLSSSGIAVTKVSDYTGSPEIMDGRVKTLHPKVHGGILANRDIPEHMAQMEEHGMRPIDLVAVNLYPFQQTVAKPGVRLEEAIENIDIGGPTMIRSAAKNHAHVAVVVDPEDYVGVIEELKENDGEIGDQLRFELALKAFTHTASYDTAISIYLSNIGGEGMPLLYSPAYSKLEDLRYGENPHQEAAVYAAEPCPEPSLCAAEQLSGKALSYNNYLDLEAALSAVGEFDEPAVVVIKHNNPCGAAVGASLVEAFRNAWAGDPLSAFGSVVGLNRRVDVETAKEIASPDKFVEAIIAPDYDAEALEIITTGTKWGNSVRILKVGDSLEKAVSRELQARTISGGVLVQGPDVPGFDESGLKCVTEEEPTAEQIADLKLAWLISKHVRSNAIVLAKDGMVVGVGAGQMSRVDAAIIAARKAGERAKGSVLASDAFMPFADTVEKAAEAGVAAIIQPGGSVGDKKAIEAANAAGMAMVFTGSRHFRH